MEKFKNVLSANEEERKLISHCVANTRILYSDFRKYTLAKGN